MHTSIRTSLVLLAAMMVSQASAQFSLDIGSATAIPGETGVCLPVNITAGGAAHNGAGLSLVATGSPALSAPSVDVTGSIYSGAAAVSSGFTVGVNSGGGVGDITADGEILSLCFDVPATATDGTTYAIDAVAGPFTVVNFGLGGESSPTVAAGTISVVPEPSALILAFLACSACLRPMRKRNR